MRPLRYLAGAWVVRRHIANVLRGTLPCAKCGAPVANLPDVDSICWYRKFECGCGAIWWAPFGWDYVRMLIESQMSAAI